VGKLVLAALLLPVLDLWLLFRIAGALGGWSALACAGGSAFVGYWLVKREGRLVRERWRLARTEGRVPEEGLVGSALVLLAGVLLILPGFLTDALALLLLIPASRRALSALTGRWLERRIRDGHVQVFGFDARPAERADVIDVEAREVLRD
jgi:UPF0716 protein FxsA